MMGHTLRIIVLAVSLFMSPVHAETVTFSLIGAFKEKDHPNCPNRVPSDLRTAGYNADDVTVPLLY
jgi:hypothetical protein